MTKDPTPEAIEFSNAIGVAPYGYRRVALALDAWGVALLRRQEDAKTRGPVPTEPRACQADAKGRTRRMYSFEVKNLSLPEPATPAPELPRKVEPGTPLQVGARYRITEIASWEEDPGHRTCDELVCWNGPSAGTILPGWGTTVGGGCWRAHAPGRDTYVTGLELVAEAPAKDEP